MSAAAHVPGHPVRVFDTVIHQVQDLTPHFRRITVAGPALDRFGVPGPILDLRIKLLLPGPGQPMSLPGAPDGHLHAGWYQDWLRSEQPGRGFIRSYTVRALRTTASGRELDVDFVIHPDTGGRGAPASDWARAAEPGIRAVFIGPDASAITDSTPRSETGIRWNPNGSRRVLLAGDETALPAISSVLESLPADVTGHAFLEVPDGSDFRDINTGSAVGVTWLARNPAAAARGHLLHEAVRSAVPASAHSGTQPRGSNGRRPEQPDPTTAEKRQGEPAPQACPPGTGIAQNMYAWVAAEAGTVKRLRRYLVNEVGLDPRQSEFRAYWSLGKAGSGVNGSRL